MTVGTILLMAITLAGALLAVNVRNILHAIFGLAVALFGISGLFLILGSPFVAVMQVLIYIGGISVAMIFAVMLSSVVSRKGREPAARRLAALVGAVGLFVGIALVLRQTDLTATAPPDRSGAGIERVGEYLLNQYNVVFESLSVVLLLAIIGAIVIARRIADPPDQETDSAPEESP